MSKDESIKVLITGGTIDDIDYQREEDAPKNPQTLVPDLLKNSRITFNYEFEVLMLKESLFITDKDRLSILEACQKSTGDKIIISHGTNTMVQTAQLLGKDNLNKTIVLFGAFVPANKENSDAMFNLGAAFIAVQLLPKGVYVVMNGKVLTWDNVKKDFTAGNFKER